MRGKFIVFEGIDGSGKTIASQMFHSKLLEAQVKAHWMFLPSKDHAGELLRKYLYGEPCNQQEMALLFAADRCRKNDEIQAMLADGVTVICDRYALSTMVYQWDSLPHELLLSLCTTEPFALMPDWLLYVHLDPETSIIRMSHRANTSIFETRDKLVQLSHRYTVLLKENPELFGAQVAVIDNNGPVSELESSVASFVKLMQSKEEEQHTYNSELLH